MAIGKLLKGSNAGGLVDYLLSDVDHKGDARPQARIVGGTFGSSGRDAKRNFEVFASLRPNLTRNVVHMSISLPSDDRELTETDWAEMGRTWAEGMGFDGYLTVCHGDHIHVAASRVRLNGDVVSDSHDFRRSEALVREIEERFDLIRVEASHLLNPERATTHVTAPNRGEFALMEKEIISTKSELQALLSDLTAGPITASDFVNLLEARGVDVRPNISLSTGRLAGFSFGLDGRHFTASALGRKFTLKNLEQRGFSYDQNRDSETLVAAKERSELRAATNTTPTAGAEPAKNAGRPDADAGTDLQRDQEREQLGNVEAESGFKSFVEAGSFAAESTGLLAENNPGNEARIQGELQSAEENPIANQNPNHSRVRASGGGSSDANMAAQSFDWAFLNGDGWEALFAFFRMWARSMKATFRASAATPKHSLPPPSTETRQQVSWRHKLANNADHPASPEPDRQTSTTGAALLPSPDTRPPIESADDPELLIDEEPYEPPPSLGI